MRANRRFLLSILLSFRSFTFSLIWEKLSIEHLVLVFLVIPLPGCSLFSYSGQAFSQNGLFALDLFLGNGELRDVPLSFNSFLWAETVKLAFRPLRGCLFRSLR